MERQIAYLASDRAKAEAFASVVHTSPEGLPGYLRGLMPVQLRLDTLVTNHGYEDGEAAPYQAVLQAGTAVLIDRYGAPKVRCACGNPLDRPRTERPEKVVGRTWAGFRAEEVTVVVPAPTPVPTFTVVDVRTGESVERPAPGRTSPSATPTGPTSPATTTPPAPATPTDTPPGTPTDRYTDGPTDGGTTPGDSPPGDTSGGTTPGDSPGGTSPGTPPTDGSPADPDTGPATGPGSDTPPATGPGSDTPPATGSGADPAAVRGPEALPGPPAEGGAPAGAGPHPYGPAAGPGRRRPSGRAGISSRADRDRGAPRQLFRA
ncbi:hypothetical protein LUX02_22605 [Streptomyces somaliensis]|nr:hypothetical protein [Streptomyces somaliensis]